MVKVVVFNLGCKVNQYESDMIVNKLKSKGDIEVSERLEYAEYYIVNTCAVTSEAEKKSRQCIARIKKINPSAKILICGCASENNPKQFEKSNVIYISGTANKEDLANLMCKNVNVSVIPTVYEDVGNAYSLRTRSYIKVQDGCNNFCSYCLIPYVRGRSRSRNIESIVDEINETKNKCLEIVLTAINLSAYGLDIGINLCDLINSLSSFDIRIRLGSVEMNIIDDKLLNSLKQLKNFCPHFHLSLQSGDDSVLKCMNRHYSTSDFFDKVELIRKYFTDAAITTDIICGFPTETNEQFLNTCAFIEKVGFSDLHVFPYSKREGTIAAKLTELAPTIVSERAEILSKIKQRLKTNYILQFINKPIEVLFEDCDGEICSGYSKNYIKVYGKGFCSNSIENVVPTELFLDGLKV
ncbi:MAG: tRNA (N(6)-L-threonylcarbamoyladenosine(37)-C(2))-methylthiotransferase MtaB [Clostridia bacterium]